MNTHDWNSYRDQFPVRYWQHGAFDEKLLSMLNDLHTACQFKSALDVGGGVFGTIILKEFAKQNFFPVDLLDPFISVKPEGIRKQINWNNNEQYDLIVARGSINYLTLTQIQKLKEMIKPGGIFIANTFLNPPTAEWSEREAINTHGEKGKERSRLIGNTIEHQLIFPEYTISHNFFYYSPEQYKKVFCDLEIENYSKNSFIITAKK